MKAYHLKLLMLVFCVLCFSSCTPNKSDSTGENYMKTFAVSEYLDYFNFIGRIPLTDSGFACDWGGSGFAIKLYCEGDISFHYIKDSEADIFFTVYIDGIRQENRLQLSGLEGNCIVASDLSRGSHVIELYKQTQIQKELLCEFDQISFKGKFEDLTQEKKLNIEFIGDSITAGIGNLGRDGIDGGEPVNSDTTRTYSFITARELNADFSIIAQGGANLTGTATGIWMPSVYKYTSFERNLISEWSSNNLLDIIVVNLGTNDRGVNSDVFIDGVVDMGHMLREKHPDAKIIFCIGMMLKGERTVEFKRAVKQLGEAENGFYFLMLPTNNEGSGAHPNVDGNEEAADALISFIRENILTEET